MPDIWQAAFDGDVEEVQRLVGLDPSLLDARDPDEGGITPLMYASQEGHVGVIRWLLDKGAAINERDDDGYTALRRAACADDRPAVVRLLLESGANPTIADHDEGLTPLIAASRNYLREVVRVLLGHAVAKATVNHRGTGGETALCEACYWGYDGVARALLESGADPTIADDDGTTPMAFAKQDLDEDDVKLGVSAVGRRACVAALGVSLTFHSLCFSLPAPAVVVSLR
jgi:ankyrin repeat protein